MKPSKLGSDKLAVLDGVKKRRPHNDVYDKTCDVCKHEYREALERRYMGWATYSELSEITGIDKSELLRHFRAMGKHLDRSKNIDELAAIGMEEANERGIMKTLDADQVIKLLQIRGKLDGRLESRSNDQGPRTVVIVGFPQLGGQNQKSIEARAGGVQVQLLPPAVPVELSDEAQEIINQEKNSD